MALIQFLWLRRLIRRHTKPIAASDANVWKKRLSIAYMLAAWNAFGIVCYMMATGKSDWSKHFGYQREEIKMTAAQQWTKTLGIKEATVYRVSGLKVQKYQVQNDDLDDNDRQQDETAADAAAAPPSNS